MFSTSADDNLLQEAASKFLPSTVHYQFAPTTGGVNNVVRYLDIPATGEKFILRVYNNGKDSHRVRFEHAILNQLQTVQPPLSFKIPTTVPSLETGQSHILLSNGAEASLFHIIPGKLPKLTKVREIGTASGELCSAMGKIHIDLTSPNPPYYDIYKVHHAVSRELFLQEVSSSAFDEIRSTITELTEELRAIEELSQKLLDVNLPRQLIHGDLHYDNVLVTEDGVSGLLDFEFCAYDWRAMELAICLSKYAGEPGALSYFDEFIEGFMVHGELTPLEISVLPDLINLRILSNVVYFVGRAIAKEDSITSLTTRAANYLNRIKWIKANREAITGKIESCIAKKETFCNI